MNWIPPTTLSPPYTWLTLAGLVVTVVFWARLARRDHRLLVVYIAALMGAFLGAKVAYLLAEGWRDLDQPDAWLRLATGKSIVGALLGGYAAVELAKLLAGYGGVTGDWFAFIAPGGILLGRAGCWLHGCCLGRPWNGGAFAVPDAQGVDRWPAVPVEMLFNVLFLASLLFLRRRRQLVGQHFHLYLISYGLFRFAHEFARDTVKVAGPFSGYQFLCLALTLFGLWAFRRRARTTTQARLAS